MLDIKRLQKYRYAKDNFGDEALNIPCGVWSEKKEILYIEEDQDGSFNINLSRGSFPFLTEKEVKKRFKFFIK